MVIDTHQGVDSKRSAQARGWTPAGPRRRHGERLGLRQPAHKGAPGHESFFGDPMGRDAKDTVYCSIQMPIAQGRELLELIAKLRASGAHPSLESVFKEAEGELQMSIEFVEGMLEGEGRLDHRLH